MQHLEVSGAVRHIYIYIYVIRRLKVNRRQLKHVSVFVACYRVTANRVVLFDICHRIHGATFWGRLQNCVKRVQIRHVCPSVRMEQLGSHWADFHEI